jgi:hypothetical protein
MIFAVLLSNPVWGKRTSSAINGQSKTKNLPYVYWVTVVSDNDNFYELVGWTLESSAVADKSKIQSLVNTSKVY